MKLEKIKTQVSETYIEGPDITVSVYAWGNGEGCSFLVHGNGKGIPLRLASSMRWEEVEILIAALTLAKTA